MFQERDSVSSAKTGIGSGEACGKKGLWGGSWHGLRWKQSGLSQRKAENLENELGVIRCSPVGGLEGFQKGVLVIGISWIAIVAVMAVAIRHDLSCYVNSYI